MAIMDSDQPPPSGFHMTCEIHGGQRGMAGPFQPDLDPPHLAIDQPGSAATLCPTLLSPPSAPLVPAGRLSSDDVAPTCPIHVQRLPDCCALHRDRLHQDSHVRCVRLPRDCDACPGCRRADSRDRPGLQARERNRLVGKGRVGGHPVRCPRSNGGKSPAPETIDQHPDAIAPHPLANLERDVGLQVLTGLDATIDTTAQASRSDTSLT